MARTMFKRCPRDVALKRELMREQMKKRADKVSRVLCEYANLALNHFNEFNNETGTEYELVREEGCGAFQRGRVWFQHINFLAKPKGAPDSEIKLFFTEITSGTNVVSCSIVGPQGVVTGARGCKACQYGDVPRRREQCEKAAAQHPLDVNFTKGRYPPEGPLSTWDTSVLDM